jgi:hypothetical protein
VRGRQSQGSESDTNTVNYTHHSVKWVGQPGTLGEREGGDTVTTHRGCRTR